MPAMQLFDSFGERVFKGEIDLHSHVIKVYATNATIDPATHQDKADVAEITIANGYTGPIDISAAVSRTGSLTKAIASMVSWTGSGAGFGPLSKLVIYDDTHASDALIGFWDRGSPVTIVNGQPFQFEPDGSETTGDLLEIEEAV